MDDSRLSTCLYGGEVVPARYRLLREAAGQQMKTQHDIVHCSSYEVQNIRMSNVHCKRNEHGLSRDSSQSFQNTLGPYGGNAEELSL